MRIKMNSAETFRCMADLIKKSQQGDSPATMELIDRFDPLFMKYSYIYGKMDEDLNSELKIAFIKCIKNFRVDEQAYLEQFYFISPCVDKINSSSEKYI